MDLSRHPLLYRSVPIVAGAAIAVGAVQSVGHNAGAAHFDFYRDVSAVYKFGGGGSATAPLPVTARVTYAGTASAGLP
jgi:hypothetical protein